MSSRYYPVICVLAMMMASSDAAVIEVTAGGDVSEPTYQFSDERGESLANLTATSAKVKASVDLETGRGNSVDDLATRLVAAEATGASQAAQLTTSNSNLDKVTANLTEVAGRLASALATIAALQQQVDQLASTCLTSVPSQYLTQAEGDARYSRTSQATITQLAREACWAVAGYEWSQYPYPAADYGYPDQIGWTNKGPGECSRLCYVANYRYFRYIPHRCDCMRAGRDTASEPGRQVANFGVTPSRVIIGQSCPLPFEGYTVG